jgi:hypothetical protein
MVTFGQQGNLPAQVASSLTSTRVFRTKADSKNVVIPAKAGIHVASLGTVAKAFRIKMDSRFPGNGGSF